MKQVKFKRHNPRTHWVGDGFPVRSVFTYSDIASEISPFLLMDYASPTRFPPTDQRKGVGEHPHRGFETVTIVYEGEVEHRDSAGGGGTIGPDEVQWMTAASGLVHEEFHGKDYARRGGDFEMIQLWVNLPARLKMSVPSYQSITRDRIPAVKLRDEEGLIRVIAGEYDGVRGPAITRSPINLWDMRITRPTRFSCHVPEGHTAALFVLNGSIHFPDGHQAKDAELVVLDSAGSEMGFETQGPAKMLFLGGEPLNEPIVGYGPFVMNSPEEIQQAFIDYRSGKMGRFTG
jgi:redox-sensitive bicupin YhaK (pirin superfamily)